MNLFCSFSNPVVLSKPINQINSFIGSWTAIPNFVLYNDNTPTTGGKITGGGRSMYFDQPSGNLYFTTTNVGPQQQLAWGIVPNIAGGFSCPYGYSLGGYNTNTQKMFALPNGSIGPFIAGPGIILNDYITKINGNLFVSSTAFSGNGNIGIYNLTTFSWSTLPNTSTINGRIQLFAYDPINNALYMGGNFTSTTYGNYLTQYSFNTNTLSNINCTGVNGVVSFLTYDTINQRLYVGANTVLNANTSVGVVTTLLGNGICIYDVPNSVWINQDLGIKANVNCMCGDWGNNKLYVSAPVTTYMGLTTNGLGVLNTSTLTWSNIGLTSSLLFTPQNTVLTSATAMLLYNGNLIVGGPFPSVNGNTQLAYVFKYNPINNKITNITYNTFSGNQIAGGYLAGNTTVSSFATDYIGNLYATGVFYYPASYYDKYYPNGYALGLYDTTIQVLQKNVANVYGFSAICQIDNANIFISLFSPTGNTAISGTNRGSGIYNVLTNTFSSNSNFNISSMPANGTNGVSNAASLSGLTSAVYDPTYGNIYITSFNTSMASGTYFGCINLNPGNSYFQLFGWNGSKPAGGGRYSWPNWYSHDPINRLIYYAPSNGATFYNYYPSGVSTGNTCLNGITVYNIANNSWYALDYTLLPFNGTRIPSASSSTTVLKIDYVTGNLYIVQTNYPTTSTNQIYRYNIASNVVTTLCTVSAYPAGTSVVALEIDISNQILYFGGINIYTGINGNSNPIGNSNSISLCNIGYYDMAGTTGRTGIGSISGNIAGGISKLQYNSSSGNLYVAGTFGYVDSRKMINYAVYNTITSTWIPMFPPKNNLMTTCLGQVNPAIAQTMTLTPVFHIWPDYGNIMLYAVNNTNMQWFGTDSSYCFYNAAVTQIQ